MKATLPIPNVGSEAGGIVSIVYRCVSPGCDAAGTLALDPHGHGVIECPGRCGTVYLPILDNDARTWRLVATVIGHGPEADPQ